MTNYWMCRPAPAGKSRMKEFLDHEVLAIGWSNLGDLSTKNRDEIKGLLEHEGYTSYELGRAYASVDIFVNQMAKNDLVLVPDGDTIHLCRITGDYAFEARRVADDWPHQRSVQWLTAVERSNLPIPVRNSLKARTTAVALQAHAAAIDSLAAGTLPASEPETKPMTVSYPLRPGDEISFTVPADMTREEAERLGTFVKTLYFE